MLYTKIIKIILIGIDQSGDDDMSDDGSCIGKYIFYSFQKLQSNSHAMCITTYLLPNILHRK